MIEELTIGRKCNNSFPTGQSMVPYRIAVIGEAPGEDEEKQGKPFVGKAGMMIRGLLTEAGINPDYCYFGNVCQFRPPKNKIEHFPWTSYQIQQGIAQLREDIKRFQPNLVILLGNTPLRASKGTYANKKGKQQTFAIGDWRGSVFLDTRTESPFFGFKVIPTYHPSYLFRVYGDIPFVRLDLSRARKHGCFKEVPASGLVLDVSPNKDTIIERLRLIRQHKIPISVDIEGYVNAINCVSISPTAKEAFIIPFETLNGDNFWSLEEEVEIWYELALTMEDVEVPKSLQSGMYDRFVKAFTWKMLIRNMKDDIMLKHWELYAEFPKGLDLQTSIYTEHPYYKYNIDTTDQETYWQYCCMDSAITNECNEKQEKQLQKFPRSYSHYKFNTSLLDPFLYIELVGMRLDTIKKQNRVNELRQQVWFNNKTKTSGGVEQLALEEQVGWKINVNSPDDMQRFIEQLGLPVTLKKRKSGEFTPTADYETLLKLALKTKNNTLLQCIKVRRIRKRLSNIEGITSDFDGRVRASTNIVGTKTGRTSSSTAPTGEGTNLTTIPDDDRDLFIADEGHDFGQMDLEGADCWTVAAHCARLGDTTMLDDLLAGLKPAKVLALMLKYGEVVNSWSRTVIKEKCNEIEKKSYAYFMCKIGTHGTNYRMGPEKLANNILLESEGEIMMSESEASVLQNYYLKRYRGVHLWHQWCERELKTKGYIISPSGNRRLFFDRKDNSETLGDFCSTEPQNTTTYATNLALKKLWLDPDNRLPGTNRGLKIWPCHQIHDALCMQWKYEYRDFARIKVREWFNNPLLIAGIQITIPFEGNFGPNWQQQDNKL